ncbi:uncharacterized protein BDR25DRAFT_347167 [Lindgomyces ingoldianus]|uniref:Uncharacterized protein n=1 Tax=Lindgomyces ingoldianus TaxID=673940 RepID=A0ACB6Q989_9PLEO|nr:uncharacterized protein BDR25DRAFT_347167 [Lindgomyces ingoldianus]KAF2463519.1 hypothetical protein BDR25DRAFT_347167 [Lindgomyces ingoldianus]
MPIRPAKWTDLSTIATLCATAFYDDELFGTLMHPLRDQFFSDYKASFTRRIRENWWDWSHVWWVATVLEADHEVVAGVAEWEFKGTMADTVCLKQWDPRRAIMPTVKAMHCLHTTIRPNRAANPDPILRNPFPSAHPFFEHHWKGTRANSVYLELLAVDPKYQGRGLAKELVQWGLDTARENHVCASVISSISGHNLYLRMGFTEEVGRCTEGEGNPLKDLGSGWILFANTSEEQRSVMGNEAKNIELGVSVESFRSDPSQKPGQRFRVRRRQS